MEPSRTTSGHRLYTQGDIDRLKLLRRATQAGHPIGKVSALSDEAIRAIVRGEVELTKPDAPPPSGGTALRVQPELFARCCDAVLRLDRDLLDWLVAQGAARMGCIELFENLITPLMHWVGSRWQDGALGIAHEHLATAAIRAQLDRMRVPAPVEGSGPGMVLTTPPGKRHEIGLLMCAVVGSMEGWKCHYFGPEMPAADIARTADAMGASLVALGAPTVGNERDLYDQLIEVRDLLPGGVRLIAGGAGAMALEEDLAPRGIRCIRDVRRFEELLKAS